MTEAKVPPAASQPVEVIPQEDSGSSTAVRYLYQYQVAAAHSVSIARNGGVRIVCEWHTDFLMELAENEWEIVSVKHLDEGSWSFSKLFDEGGLARLFDVWIALGRVTRARLCTNAGFSTAKTPISARSLEVLCGDEMQLDLLEPDDQLCSAVAWAILKVATKGKLDNVPVAEIPATARWTSAEGLPAGMLEAVREFLGVLRIERFPSKAYIRNHVVKVFVEPLLKDMQRDVRAADAAYDKLLDEVCKASRDNDHQPANAVEQLTTPDAMSLPNKIDERVRRRTITAEAVRNYTAAAVVDDPSPLPAGRRPPRAPGGQTLESKLVDAKVGSDDRTHAQRLRDLWHDSWPRLATGFPQDLEAAFALEEEILHVVRLLRLELAGSDHFGTRLMTGLHERLRVEGLHRRPSLALHDAHLRGLAYELSDQCLFNFLDIGGSS